MPRFTLRGWHYDETDELTWADGELAGDPLLVDEVLAAFDVGVTLPASPTGPWYEATVEDGHAVAVVARRFLLRAEVVAGEVPPPAVAAPKLPPGVVG